MYAIETHNLTKNFGKLIAVNNLNIKVEEGDFFGFLGPNGAGKTTTIRMLSGVLKPTNGSAKIFGCDIVNDGKKAKENIGLIPDFFGFYEDLSAYAHLEYYSALSGIPKKDRPKKIEEMLDFVGLKERQNSPVKEYSHGMRKRLAIAQALINKPKLLLLDEPLEGLDPKGQYEVKQLIEELKKTYGITIFISSHRLPEVEELCTKVGIILRGNLVKIDKIKNLQQELKKVVGIFVDVELVELTEGIIKEVKSIEGVINVEVVENTLKLKVSSSEIIPKLTEKIVMEKGKIKKVIEKEPTLEEIYLELTK